MPTHQQYGAVWKQLTDMGHDEELVKMWATENEIIAKGQECYNRIPAPVAMQHDDHIVGASQDQSTRILIDVLNSEAWQCDQIHMPSFIVSLAVCGG